MLNGFTLSQAYFGGEARCEAEAGINNDFDPNDLICGGCSDVARAQICPRHGSDYLAYKCRYCCSVAIFFCFGTTHFCGLCHDDFRRITETPKGSLPNCPAGWSISCFTFDFAASIIKLIVSMT